MKLNRVFILIFWSYTSEALDYHFTCSMGRLISFESKIDESSSECKLFLKQGFKTCFDTRKDSSKAQSSLISISTPIDHYYVSKESTDYLRSELEEVVRFAVSNDLDPYLMLAIKILESPPTQRSLNDKINNGIDLYKSQYGLIPLDGIAVADFFGCKVGPLEQTQTDSFRQVTGLGKTKEIVIAKTGTSKKICLGKLQTGVEPNFIMNCEKFTTCCADIIGDWANASTRQCDDIKSQEVRQMILSLAAGSYIKRRFQYAAKEKISGVSDPGMKLSIIAQSFNGYGKFGIAEKTMGTKHCLNNFDFSQKPLYGAGAAELMLNSFLANSEIREMVAVELKKSKKNAPASNLCGAYGSDESHTISAYTFSNQMKQFLENQDKCIQKTYLLKNSSRQEFKNRSAGQVQ